MAKIIVHDIEQGIIERDETDAEREAREAAVVIEEQIETVARERGREENRVGRMMRAQARVLRRYKRNNSAGTWQKFLIDVFAEFDELGGDE